MEPGNEVIKMYSTLPEYKPHFKVMLIHPVLLSVLVGYFIYVHVCAQ